MLHQLELCNVGPAPLLNLELGPRLNLITGDNGLGKSFLLDAAWFALTRRWPQQLNPQITSGLVARPIDRRQPATISFKVNGLSGSAPTSYTSRYVLEDQDWVGPPGRPINPGMVLYAMADGSFAVWDPARNYWKQRGNHDVQERVSGYVFSPRNIWDGLDHPISGKGRLCNGLIDDWASWCVSAWMTRVITPRSAPVTANRCRWFTLPQVFAASWPWPTCWCGRGTNTNAPLNCWVRSSRHV